MLGAALALLALAIPTGGTTASPLEEVDVVLIGIEPTAQALYAKDRGFFARQGLDANVKILVEPTQTTGALLSGDADFSAGTTGGLALLKSRGAPVKLIAGGALHDPDAPTSYVVAGPGKRFSRPRDLVGKRIGIDGPNTLGHIGLLKWLKTGGVSQRDVTLVPFGFAQMIGPLVQGQIDAGVMPEPRVTQALARGATRIAPFLNAACPNRCLITVQIAHRNVDANLAARFRNAIQAASLWANDKKNRRASAQILAKYTGLKPSLIMKSTRTTFATRLRLAPAQAVLDVHTEFGVIPPTKASDLLG
jgi:ABC-type nitrate/sulfonate/bicarbonate transport system substrate-binding protein